MKNRPIGARARPACPRLNQLSRAAQFDADEPHRLLYARPYRTGRPGITGVRLITRQEPLEGRRAVLGSRQRLTRILQKAWSEVRRVACRSGRMPPHQSLEELRGLIAAAPRANLRVGQLACTLALRRFVRSLGAPA